jgi:hypothetical protein
MRWEMPAQVFPPGSFGPCAIAGEKFTAVSGARVAPASNRVFHFQYSACFERRFEPSDSAAMIQQAARRGSMLVGRSTAAMPQEI